MNLSKKKLKQLQAEFEARKVPAKQLIKKYKINRSALYNLAKKHNWQKTKLIDPTKPKVGCPTKYKPEFCKQATYLCMLGYTNEKLAVFFGVEITTIYGWKKTKPEFFNALLAGREKASSKVAVSLFQRACGYSHKDEKIFCSDGEIIRAETVKHYPPETKAIALWLKNKYPDLWKEKQEIEGILETRIGKIKKEDVEAVNDLFDELTK